MKNCDYCGEYKKVRKEYSFLGSRYEIGSCLGYNFICEDCDKARKIILEKELEDKKKKEEKRQKSWIKTRNKILEENNEM